MENFIKEFADQVNNENKLLAMNKGYEKPLKLRQIFSNLITDPVSPVEDLFEEESKRLSIKLDKEKEIFRLGFTANLIRLGHRALATSKGLTVEELFRKIKRSALFRFINEKHMLADCKEFIQNFLSWNFSILYIIFENEIPEIDLNSVAKGILREREFRATPSYFQLALNDYILCEQNAETSYFKFNYEGKEQHFCEILKTEISKRREKWWAKLEELKKEKKIIMQNPDFAVAYSNVWTAATLRARRQLSNDSTKAVQEKGDRMNIIDTSIQYYDGEMLSSDMKIATFLNFSPQPSDLTDLPELIPLEESPIKMSLRELHELATKQSKTEILMTDEARRIFVGESIDYFCPMISEDDELIKSKLNALQSFADLLGFQVNMDLRDLFILNLSHGSIRNYSFIGDIHFKEWLINQMVFDLKLSINTVKRRIADWVSRSYQLEIARQTGFHQITLRNVSYNEHTVADYLEAFFGILVLHKNVKYVRQGELRVICNIILSKEKNGSEPRFVEID